MRKPAIEFFSSAAQRRFRSGSNGLADPFFAAARVILALHLRYASPVPTARLCRFQTVFNMYAKARRLLGSEKGSQRRFSSPFRSQFASSTRTHSLRAPALERISPRGVAPILVA
jgi:hypothetical protein